LSDHSWLVVAIFSAQVSSNDWYSLANSPANGPLENNMEIAALGNIGNGEATNEMRLKQHAEQYLPQFC
jgi:hypothetical protein